MRSRGQWKTMLQDAKRNRDKSQFSFKCSKQALAFCAICILTVNE